MVQKHSFFHYISIKTTKLQPLLQQMKIPINFRLINNTVSTYQEKNIDAFVSNCWITSCNPIFTIFFINDGYNSIFLSFFCGVKIVLYLNKFHLQKNRLWYLFVWELSSTATAIGGWNVLAFFKSRCISRSNGAYCLVIIIIIIVIIINIVITSMILFYSCPYTLLLLQLLSLLLHLSH